MITRVGPDMNFVTVLFKAFFVIIERITATSPLAHYQVIRLSIKTACFLCPIIQEDYRENNDCKKFDSPTF